MRHFLICAAVLAVSCGSVATNPDASATEDGAPPVDDGRDGAVSGTRLKLSFADFGGTLVLYQMRDAMRDELCYPNQWDDGNWYCTPNSASIVFSDAACTNPMGQVYVDATCPSEIPDYFLEYANTACTYEPTRVYRRGAMLGTTTYYYLNSDGSCSAPSSNSNYRHFALGADVPRADLVELTERTAPTSDRFAQVFLESADGARIPYIAHDATEDVHCYFNRIGDGTHGKCQPYDAAYAGYFGDSACSQPKTQITAGCEAPDYIRYTPPYTCEEDYDVRFYNRGSQGGALYYDSGGTCMATTPDPSYTYYASTTEISTPLVPREPLAIAGRQVVPTYYTDGASRFRDYSHVDTTHDNVPCYPTQTGEESFLCVPSQAYVSTYFYTDAACTTQLDLVEVYQAQDGCDPRPVPTIATRSSSVACTTTYQFYEMGAEHTAPVYTNFGSCAEYSHPSSRLYRLGTPIANGEMGTGTLLADP
jgi:hypothetical protein